MVDHVALWPAVGLAVGLDSERDLIHRRVKVELAASSPTDLPPYLSEPK